MREYPKKLYVKDTLQAFKVHNDEEEKKALAAGLVEVDFVLAKLNKRELPKPPEPPKPVEERLEELKPVEEKPVEEPPKKRRGRKPKAK